MTEHTRTAGGDPRRLAPSADPRWVDSFVVELRLLDVPGAEIGDHLAVVEEHLRETGQPVRDAFGDPRSYAVDLAGGHPSRSAIDRDTVIGSVGVLAGIALLPLATSAALAGRPVAVTAGGLVVAAALGAGLAALVLASTTVLRFLVDRRWAPLLAVPLLVGSLAAALVLLPQRVGGVPAAVVAALGLVALVVGVWHLWRMPADLVSAPGEDPPGAGHGRLLVLALGPGLAALACLASWALHGLA